MNSYEAKIEAKKERYLELAASAQSQSNAAYEKSSRIASMIPFGQPILVGHHSERGHRADIKRIHNAMNKSCELADKAKYYTQKAASVGTGGISSDDPEATDKLAQKLACLKKLQDTMKKANAIIRSNPKNIETPEKLAKVAALVGSESRAGQLFQPDFCGRIGFADYQLTNNNANIKRIRDRIEQLAKKAEQTDSEITFDGGKIVLNYTDNRLQIFFDEIPAEEIRSELKSHGFHWSKYNQAWQRFISNSALYSAKQICKVA